MLDAREDEPRLLYVGFTRAKHALHLSAAGTFSILEKAVAAVRGLEPLAA